MKKLFLLLFILNLQWAAGQTVYTVAGSGTEGFSGDGGLATAAEFAYPTGVAVDSSGNIYIADNSNCRIRKVNTSGIISTIAGNGTPGFSGDGGLATAAQLNYPEGVALDKMGNLYIADHTNSRIRMVNTSGIISTIAGSGAPGYLGDRGPAIKAQLRGPRGVAVAVNGDIYIADSDNNHIRKIDTQGIITTVAGDSTGVGGYNGDGIPAIQAKVDLPYAISLDKTGNLYIADDVNNRIRMVNTAGIISTVAGVGTCGYSGDGGPAAGAPICAPLGLALDAAGNLFISDYFHGVIRKVNTSGVITTFAGDSIKGYAGDGGPATSAEFNSPEALAFDGSGNLYIADPYNMNIRKVVLTTGVNEFDLRGAGFTEAYPNPSNGIVTIHTSGTSASFLECYNMLGELIHTEKIVSDKTRIDLCSQPKGIYFYRVLSDAKLIGSGKLVIE